MDSASRNDMVEQGSSIDSSGDAFANIQLVLISLLKAYNEKRINNAEENHLTKIAELKCKIKYERIIHKLKSRIAQLEERCRLLQEYRGNTF